MLDLANLFGDEGEMPKAPEVLVDNSGRPIPTRATIHLTSGIQVDAIVRYTGLMPGSTGSAPIIRKYSIIAEINWDTDNVAFIDVDRCPPDVAFMLRIPETVSDQRAILIGENLRWRVDGRAYQPSFMRKFDYDPQ